MVSLRVPGKAKNFEDNNLPQTSLFTFKLLSNQNQTAPLFWVSTRLFVFDTLQTLDSPRTSKLVAVKPNHLKRPQSLQKWRKLKFKTLQEW